MARVLPLCFRFPYCVDFWHKPLLTCPRSGRMSTYSTCIDVPNQIFGPSLSITLRFLWNRKCNSKNELEAQIKSADISQNFKKGPIVQRVGRIYPQYLPLLLITNVKPCFYILALRKFFVVRKFDTEILLSYFICKIHKFWK